MPQILFIVEIPEGKEISSSPGYPYEWTQFENEASTILKNVKACTRLQLNAWLLPAENLLPALLSISTAAEKHHLAYSALLINGEVIELSPKANTPFKISAETLAAARTR